uniref:Uncharacterized protein n=1 Tax=Cereibacter sphaeroides (strain ATCC 17025 / ATH 2.4.3) TaxID=349102 RepID=A4WZQ2_CERS5
MDDHLGGELIGHPVEQRLVLEQAFRGREVRVLQQHRMAPPLEGHVVIVGHPVVAMDAEALGQQPREMEADEAGGAGDRMRLTKTSRRTVPARP